MNNQKHHFPSSSTIHPHPSFIFMDDIKPLTSPSSLFHKLIFKYPFLLSSPFRRTCFNHADKSSRLLRTSSTASTFIKSRAHDFPDIKGKCKRFISRIGRNGHAQGHGRGHRRRHSVSADFHYDAMSYALNFDEGHDEILETEFPLKSFSSRLPQSPPKREIECG